MEGKKIKLVILVIIISMISCGTNQRERHEELIIQTIVIDVQDERKGRPHNTSHRSWNEYWVRRVRNMRRTPDGERYAEMAIEMRRSAGLPELR